MTDKQIMEARCNELKELLDELLPPFSEQLDRLLDEDRDSYYREMGFE